MDVHEDGIDRAALFARWFKRADGATAEVLTSVPLLGVPPQFAEWEELATEAEYLAALEAVENVVEDRRREVKASEAARAATEYADLVKVKIPASVAKRLTGHDPATAAAALEAAETYTDPARRTVRETPPAAVGA